MDKVKQKERKLSVEKTINFFCCCCNFSWNQVHLNVVQLYGVFVLVFTLMKRRWFMYLAYLIIPIIGFTYVYIMDHLTQEYLKPNLDETLKRDSPFGSPHYVGLRAFTLPEFQNYLASKGLDSVNEIPTKILFTTTSSDESTLPTESEIVAFFSQYGLMDMGYEIVFPNLNNTRRKGMVLVQPMKKDEEDLDDEFYQSLKGEEFDESQPNQFLGSFTMKEFSSDTLSYTIEYEQKLKRRSPTATIQSSILSLKNNYSTSTHFGNMVGVYGHTFECENFLSSALIHFVDSAYILRESGTIVTSRVGQLPYHSLGFDFNFNRGDRRLLFFLPLLLLTVLSLFIYSIISDKENGSRSLMDLMGLRLHNYLIGKYCLFLFYYIIFAGVSYFYGLLILKSRIFTNVDFFLLWLLLIGGGLMTISYAFFFSAFFQTNLKALIPSHLVEYILPGFFSSIHIQVIGRKWQWKWMTLIYPWPLVDSLMLLFDPIADKKITIHFDHLWKDLEFGYSVLSMYFMAVVFFVLFLYLEKVLPQNFTVRKPPCFCCGAIFNFLKFCCCGYVCCKGEFYQHIRSRIDILIPAPSVIENPTNDNFWEDMMLEEEDSDDSDTIYYNKRKKKDSGKVRSEEKDDDIERIEEEISKVKDPSKFGILVRNLKKKYSKNAPRYAVNGISFRVPHHSLYGLLGENGAGKTTTIRILIGELSSTRGECYVDGKNTKSQLSDIRKSVGVCHQHNVLWSELSVEEHLFFYARVRGIDFIQQKHHVNRILNETELLNETSNPRFFSKLSHRDDQKESASEHSKEKNRKDQEKKKKKKKRLFSFVVNYMFCCFCILPFLQYFLKPARKVRDLSAGTKRKLCLAISMVGNPSTLFLDEPTTGLDPKTQHHIWKIIQQQKESKSIILTTHEMFEAEVLCDNIGIMKDGEFVASGTSLHLKAKFGKGYRLKIIRKSDDDEDDDDVEYNENGEIVTSKEKIMEFMYSLTARNSNQPHITTNPDNQTNQIIRKRLILDFGNTLIWELNFPDNFLLSHFFEEIEKRKEEVGIKDWSLNQSNLNDVFVKLIGKDRQGSEVGSNQEIEDLMQQNQDLQIEVQSLRDYITLQQQGVASTANEEEIDIQGEEEQQEQRAPMMKRIGSGSFMLDNTLETPLSPSGLSTNIRSFYEQKTKKEEERKRKERKDFSDLFEKNIFIVFFTQLYVLVKKEILLAYRRPFWSLLTIFFASIVVFQMFVIYQSGRMKDSKEYYNEMNFDTMLSQKECITWVSDEGCYHFIYTFNGHPIGQKIIDYLKQTVEEEFEDVDLRVKSFETTSSLLEWSMSHPNQTYHAILIEAQSSLSVPPNPLPFPYVEYTILHNATSFDSPHNDLPLSMTGYIQIVLDEAILFATTSRKYNLNGNIKRRKAPKYPLKEKHNLYDIFQQLGPCMYAVAFCFIATESAHRFVAMKELGFHKHLIRSGVMRFALYCSYAFYFCLVAVINGVVTYIVSVLFEIDVIRKTNIVISFSLIILYSFALLSTISITFPFLQSEKNAQAVNTIFMLLVFFTSFLFDSAVLYSIYEDASGFGWFVLYFVLPLLFAPINFCKIYADFSYKTVPIFDYKTKEYRENVGFGFDDFFSTNRFDELSLETGPTIYWCLYLIANILVYIFLGWVIYGCVESNFYSFEFLWKWLSVWDHNEAIKNNQSLLSKRSHNNIVNKKKKLGDMDEDDQDEKEDNFSVYLENLSKSYISLFPAIRLHPVLENVRLKSPKNQLLGILGPNGCGKSTLINLISGTLKITDGEIFVNDHNHLDNNKYGRDELEPTARKGKKKKYLRVKRNISSIRKLLGIVPQNDILIEKLRAKEMLELFGICKRIKLKYLNKKITKLLGEVGLSNATNEFVGNFSGGMKRKLSIGMSLIGEPSLILLDEPTTGIDVYSCYQIWQLFYEMKKHHSVILTSHKMSETELLSDRIAILNEKKFRVEGEPLELKEKYGTGYLLQVVLCKDSDRKKMDDLIHKVLEESSSQQSSISSSESSSEEGRKESRSSSSTSSFKFPEVSQNGNNVNYSVEDKLFLSKILKEVEKVKEREKKKISNEKEDDEESIEIIVETDHVEEKFIESFGISQCTLESIYMKVTLN